MKKIIFLTFTVLFTGLLFGQSQTSPQSKRIRIAVMVGGSKLEGVNEATADRLLYAITQDRKFVAVERADDFREALRNEQTFQQSGEVTDSQITELGEKYGASIMCVGKITSVLGTNNISVRFVGVESGRIVAAYTQADKLQDLESLNNTVDNISRNLLKDFAERNKLTIGQSYQGGVVAYLNASGEHGLIITKQDVTNMEITWNDAIEECNNLVIDGYDDWYLPSQKELGMCFANGDALGLHLGIKYWSSSVYGAKDAFFVKDKNPAGNEHVGKDATFRVRAVRAFQVNK